MKNIIFASVFSMFMMGLCGCDKDTAQSQPLPIVVEGNRTAKREVTKLLKANPNIYIPRGNASIPGPTTNYSIHIIEPDPNKEYSILKVEPDPNTEYSIMIIDPKTQKPPANMDPHTRATIIDQIKKRKQETSEE